MKYIFFSDIDGTIYDEKQIVAQDTKDDIIFAQQQGIEFVIATGNGHFTSIKKLANDLNIRYLILSNGAHIFDNLQQKTLYKNHIPQQIGQAIFQILDELQLQTMFWNEQSIFFSHYVTATFQKQMSRFIHQNNHQIVNKINHDLLKIEFCGEKTLIDQAIKKLAKLSINIIRVRDTFVEIINSNVSKGAAIKTFCDLFNVPLQKTASIGDSHNDLEMLKTTHYSYAMANGHPSVIKTARFQTDHVLKNGVGKAIHNFIEQNN